MLASALEAFAGLTGLSKTLIVLGATAVIVAGGATAYGIWHHEVYQSGYQAAMLDIARADTKAIGRASELRNTWRACIDGGRSWDQTTGRCQ